MQKMGSVRVSFSFTYSKFEDLGMGSININYWILNYSPNSKTLFYLIMETV